MDRLPFFVSLALVVFGLFGLAINSDVDFFGDRAAQELATARAEIALARAESRAFMREIRQVQKDHRGLYQIVEEAYFGTHPETKRKKNEKAIQGLGERPGR